MIGDNTIPPIPDNTPVDLDKLMRELYRHYELCTLDKITAMIYATLWELKADAEYAEGQMNEKSGFDALASNNMDWYKKYRANAKQWRDRIR